MENKKSETLSHKNTNKKIKKTYFSAFILLGFILGSTMGHYIFRASDENVIKLTMVYSSEKATWISQTQSLFLQYWENKRQQDPTLKPIVLNFQAYGSGDSMIALINGEVKPIIWSPASNIWVPLLNAKWHELTQSNQLIAPNMTRMIYSPIVIAMWENLYQENSIKGIKDLHNLILSHPGEIKMAHTDPRDSNSGFMATIMMTNVFLGKDPDMITLDDLGNNSLAQWMNEIEKAAIFYGKSTGFLGKYMRDQGPDALQIALLYENVVQDYSLSAKTKYNQKIVAIYPEEGTIYSDHPFCILNEQWVSKEQKDVAEEYLQFISQPDIIKLSLSNGFRPIDGSILTDPAIYQVYNNSFNEDHGVTQNLSLIKELLPPTDGNVIARIPDLWLKTRNIV